MNTQVFNTYGDSSNHQRNDMLMEIDFKWLMAGIGCWIDSERLKTDPAYASANLQRALQSDCGPLRRCANDLKNELEGICISLAGKA
jgi:hypothetical protein